VNVMRNTTLTFTLPLRCPYAALREGGGAVTLDATVQVGFNVTSVRSAVRGVPLRFAQQITQAGDGGGGGSGRGEPEGGYHRYHTGGYAPVVVYAVNVIDVEVLIIE
jgi:hypothetical protein